jgi:protein AFG1
MSVLMSRLSTSTNRTHLPVRFLTTTTSKDCLLSVYKQMAKTADIQEDPHQLRAIKELDRLYRELETYTPPPPIPKAKPDTSWWSSFTSQAKNKVMPNGNATIVPQGIYLHGGVGCGKTFAMNLFHDNLPREDKQQVHFHKFMLRVHQQMHEAKRIEGLDGDVLPRVVERTLQQGRIICFDEFQVTDVADAMILQRLFTSLIEQGAVIVATSNRPPKDLYLNGVQRDRFLPFIALLEKKLNVVSMWDSETDYRLINSKAKGVYFIGAEQEQDFDDVFHSLTKDSSVSSTNLSTQGRLVPIPRACIVKGVARFAFEDLCTKALGAADYLVIGQNFHTVFVDRIPTMSRNEVNWVRRFIIFVDSMYECHVKLIIHAKTEPDGIFQVDLADAACDEVFAFDRTRSRLEEMRSQQYLQKRWAGKSTTSETTSKLRVEPSLSENMTES